MADQSSNSNPWAIPGQPTGPAPQNNQANTGMGGTPVPPPPMAQPMGGQPVGGQPMPPPPPEDTTPANFQLGSKLPKVIGVKIPEHTLKFDEQHFLHLLAGSISLTKDEKARIVESVPKLRQSQVDELIRIFEEERLKFSQLSAKHVDQLKKLEDQHYADWMDIEVSQKAQDKKGEDQAKAEALRKQLGL